MLRCKKKLNTFSLFPEIFEHSLYWKNKNKNFQLQKKKRVLALLNRSRIATLRCFNVSYDFGMLSENAENEIQIKYFFLKLMIPSSNIFFSSAFKKSFP